MKTLEFAAALIICLTAMLGLLPYLAVWSECTVSSHIDNGYAEEVCGRLQNSFHIPYK